MPSRASKEDLEAVYGSTTEEALAQAALRWSNAIVSRYLKGKCNADEDQLKEIETWLAAHAYSYIFEGGAGSSGGAVRYREDKLEIQYNQVSSDFLSQTRYGQMAILLDTCDILAKLGRRRAKAWVL